MTDENKQCNGKKMMKGLVALALGLSLVSTVLSSVSLFKANEISNMLKPVVISKQYDKGQNMEKALKTKKPMIVWFYTDWCGYCQKFAPTFGKVTKNWDIKKNFAIAYVNAEYPENQGLMAEYQVQGFPTVFLVNPETKEKTQVDNNKLFVPNAEKGLIKEFLSFVKKDSNDSKKTDEANANKPAETK